MSEIYLLGIDNGGTVAKAAIFARDGRELAVAARKTESLTLAPGWVEFDAEAMWQATAAAVRRAIDKAGVAPGQIAAVACTGHGNGLYLVDAEGHPVRNAIFSADTRARAYVERWTQAGIDRRVRPKTMQALWPGQPNALLAWLADHEPSIASRTCWCLMCKDYTRMRLTGEAFAELTDMSGTSLLDVGTGQYDAGLLAAFGLGAWSAKLPPLRLAADLCGQVTCSAADITGLTPGTPVAGGLFDIDACALSSALLDENQLGMTFGTWGINQYVSPTPVVDNVFMTSRYCVPGHYLMLEGSATSAGNLEWFLRQFFHSDCRSAVEADLDLYGEINAWVEQTAADETGLLFLPFLYGSSVGADATGCLVGLSARHGRRQIARAVYEGVIFGHRLHLERLLAFRAMPQTIRASGGAARSDVWMQMAADVLGCPVEVPDGNELGALGAAMCAAVAVGVHADYPAACAAMTRCSRRFVPRADPAMAYAAKFQRFTRLLSALEPAWPDLAWPDSASNGRA
ncbi:MAG: FGGY-family carbohydrate kinase [Pirellulaceae bacterium]